MEKFFKLKENGTNVSTEIMAGITTFMTMAYILAVNPNILSASGMDRGAVFTATALSAFIATCLMALLSNYPFVLAPGMGLNAYFAYTVVLGMGYTWQAALAAVFVEGIIFIVLSLTNVREAIFNAIPMNLKHAVSVGIGLFIAFIGLQNAKIVVNNDSTLLGLFSFKGSVQAGTFNYEGITVLLALIGILITAIFLIKNVKGGILWGILITWGLGIICQFTGRYVPNADAGFYSLLPDFSSGFSIPALTPTLMKMDFSIVFSLDFVVIMFAFLFVDMFDTLGTLIGVASKADMLDKDGNVNNLFQVGDSVTVKMKYESSVPRTPVNFVIGITREDWIYCYGTSFQHENGNFVITKEKGELSITLQQLNLLRGSYTLEVRIQDEEKNLFDYLSSLIQFRMESPETKEAGIFTMPYTWNTMDEQKYVGKL